MHGQVRAGQRRQGPAERGPPGGIPCTARALYYESMEAAWQACHVAGPVPTGCATGYVWRPRTRCGRRPRWCAACDLAGGSAIYDGVPLQRRFRDVFTATAHFQVDEISRELAGRVRLDLPADLSMW